ncbi:HD domain-containing phosphohydrolase [Petroclostridium sp. X23]|uniref:HD domain-containing phosphohydrolase n=1 Tax=Petroclostridium sp. X23 TaxID=3045146 RepID=UPI0024AD9C62|nr:HD domain-containing phosphohydrolase [Petroclostridium sp. X23]WHH60697.1 diguanylate cyclase [Petroclostridium sp. X23]
MRISIKNTLIITFLILIIVPITISGVISYQHTEEILINEIKESTLKTMEHANDYFIKYHIEKIEKTIEVILATTDLPYILSNPELIKETQKEWLKYEKFNDDIWYIYTGTEDGQIYVAGDWIPPTGYDPRIRPWYIAAKTNPGQIAWSEPYLEYISNKIVVSATKLIDSPKGPIGVFAIDTSLYKLSDIVNNMYFGQGGYAILIDQNGYIITHPDPSLAGTVINNEKWLKQVYSQTKGSIYTTINGKSTFIGYITIPHTNWKLIGFIPETAIKNKIEPIKHKTIIVALLSITLAIIISIVISNYLSGVIHNLIESMKEVENGNYNVRCKYKYINEFFQLSNKFNTMVSTIDNLIKERDHVENRLKYISLHDALTNVFNRTYFEQVVQHLDSNNLGRTGALLCDLDGLKLINDTMGHDSGDNILIDAAKVIEKSLSGKHSLFRIGGDEFAILIENTTETYLQAIYRSIKHNIENHNKQDHELYLSLSIGYAVKKNESTKMEDVLKEADNMMYKEKLHSSQSKRSAIVKTLMKALEERDFITEGHAERLQFLVEKISKNVGLSEFRINDLRLLAQFHDIGKVGIPDKILFKPGTLDADELKEMQRHSEIGYRIAMASPDLTHIADWILRHHERWDGKGYPLGLKGEDIPLECRILSIADAYDAMTSDRSYRKAKSEKEALAEIQKCAGTQFDPDLVAAFISDI